jgi:hypothetical protein
MFKHLAKLKVSVNREIVLNERDINPQDGEKNAQFLRNSLDSNQNQQNGSGNKIVFV